MNWVLNNRRCLSGIQRIKKGCRGRNSNKTGRHKRALNVARNGDHPDVTTQICAVDG